MSERVIKFRDVFWYIISHWRVLLILLIIGIILGGAYSYYNSGLENINNESQVIDLLNNEDLDVNQIMDSISEMSQIDGATTIASQLTDSDKNSIIIYNYYCDLYEGRKEYSDGLEYMKLDPYNTFEGRSLYYINSISFDSLNSVLAAYKIKLNELKEKYGTLLSFSTESYSVVDPLIGADGSLQYESPTATLQIVVNADSKEKCETKLNEINDYVLKMDQELDPNIVKHEIRKIADSYYKLQDTQIMDNQRANIDVLNSLNNSINSTYNNMSNRAKAFVNYITNSPEIDWEMGMQLINSVGNTEQKGEEKAEEGQSEQITKRFISPKWVILGAVVGLIIAILILAIVYCASNKIRYEEDFETVFNVPCLGVLNMEYKTKLKGLDKQIYNSRFSCINIIHDRNIALDMIAANILICSSDKSITSVWATGTAFDEGLRILAEDVSRILKLKGIDLLVGNTLFNNASEIEKMGETGAIVLFESVRNTNNNVVQKAIQSCLDRGIKTIGIVVSN